MLELLSGVVDGKANGYLHIQRIIQTGAGKSGANDDVYPSPVPPSPEVLLSAPDHTSGSLQKKSNNNEPGCVRHSSRIYVAELKATEVLQYRYFC